MTKTQLHFPLWSVTGPATLYKYKFQIEIETVNADQLKMELSELDLPVPLSNQTEITEINITTGEINFTLKMHFELGRK